MANPISDVERRQFLKALTKVMGAGVLSGIAPAVLADDRHLIKQFRLEQPDDMLRLIFDLTASAEHKLFQLKGPDRIVLDLKKTRLADGVELAIENISPIKGVRYAYKDDQQMRVVLDVEQQLQCRSFFRKSTQNNQTQLIIELDQPAATAAAAPVKSVDDVKPAGRDLIIAIDAGHGGKDPGAVGKGGTKEKDIVLSVARRLEKLLKKEKGYKPVLTRSNDRFLPLRERIRKARQAQADLFVSVHADASPNRKARGSSVFILSENGASSEAARLLASSQNAVDLIGGVRLNDKDNGLAEVLLDLSQRYTIEASHTVATDLLSELKKVGRVHSPRVEQAGFVVLKSPDVPSVLVETAFISNPAEEKRLRTSQYQDKIARSLVKGVKRYFRSHAPDGTVVSVMAQDEHIIRAGETLSTVATRYDIQTEQLRSYNSLKSDQVRIGQILRIPTSET